MQGFEWCEKCREVKGFHTTHKYHASHNKCCNKCANDFDINMSTGSFVYMEPSCLCHTSVSGDWEERFDLIYFGEDEQGEPDYHKVKSFILQEKELSYMEGVKAYEKQIWKVADETIAKAKAEGIREAVKKLRLERKYHAESLLTWNDAVSELESRIKELL